MRTDLHAKKLPGERKVRKAYLTQKDYDYACRRAHARGQSFSLFVEDLIDRDRKGLTP